MRPNITGIASSAGGPARALFHQDTLQLDEFTHRLTLTCDASGSPQPEIDWLKDGIVLQNLTDRRIITVEDGRLFGELVSITRATLILSVVQVSDAGEYTCRASSGGVSPIPGLTAWSFVFKVNGELSSQFCNLTLPRCIQYSLIHWLESCPFKPVFSHQN